MEHSRVATTPYANIGPRGCRRRGRMAWAWLALGVAIVAGLGLRDAPTLWYAIAALPFLMAALGYYQSREQTCVFFAALGQRDLDTGAERIADRAELVRVRQQATRVWLRAVSAATLLTILAYLVASSLR